MADDRCEKKLAFDEDFILFQFNELTVKLTD